ncbi:MAG: N-acetyl-gamma-glutamyl-phosphate reductase [Candidatus Omnitrophica bacterium]|nr:N-acetyl-gamma-glutamyl-phosphate reductase [Candidatus Omnitrophota bacterium]MCM8799504.1 N-acetyl-gamma-glutamyl-phosphate reductase [Candidatus Omnitrophota bacterium]
MIKVGIIGATGYTGEELINLLLKHPEVRICYLSAKIQFPQKISEIFKKFKARIEIVCEELNFEKVSSQCELVFTALPHTVSMEIVPRLLNAKLKVIDLSADYRLRNLKLYQRFYKKKHSDPYRIKEAVYGLPEIYRQDIKKASLVANPGCYPTAAILGILPCLVADYIELSDIIIDAKSGFTGAGRKLDLSYIFAEINENLRAYKINTHQHIPEIEERLSSFSSKKLNINFVPHLVPLNRGILETIYLKKKKNKLNLKTEDLIKLYKRFYSKEPFIRIYDKESLPQVKDVVGTNFCDIGLYSEKNSSLIIIIVAIDNLLKGASGQAVQNMNIMYGYPETTALI